MRFGWFGLVLCAFVVVVRALADGSGVQVGTVAPRTMHLKVLSPELSRDEVRQIMEQYKAELGVGCSYCHAKDLDTDDVDYASEENPMKAKARLMIEMTDEINRRFLSQLGDDRYAEPFGCGGCHRGRAKPADAEG